MSDGVPDRLTQLHARWQADPSSRVFLQIAEEYRHQGRIKEALEALETGLKEHPGYLSALVAKGRCLLELGEPERACGVLERVVQQDATQMVANKLLVRACLEIGDADQARQRLDLYSLLNDSDPEIAELRRRVVALSRSPRASDGPSAEEPAERSGMDPTHPSPEAPVAEPFEPIAPPGPSQPSQPPWAQPSQSATREARRLSTPPIPPSATHPLIPVTLGVDPFPELAAPAARRHLFASLKSEGIFFSDLPVDPVGPAEPEEPEGALPDARPERTHEPPPTLAMPVMPVAASGRPVQDSSATLLVLPPESSSPLNAGAAAAAGGAEAGEVAAPAVASTEALGESEGVATVTLGSLYLRQGHLQEAERMFHEVLLREPDNAAAREALDHIAQGRKPLDAGFLLEGFTGAAGAGRISKKAYLFNSYLNRIRRAGERHVS